MEVLTQPKTKRQRAILSLIAARPVRSQDELASLLEQQGYDVTQATVSRDIKELGLLKVPLKGGAGGAFKYVEPSLGPSVHVATASCRFGGRRRRAFGGEPDRAAHASRHRDDARRRDRWCGMA